MIELKKISKIYHTGTFGGKELKAVADVNFDIPNGEIVSLIGESGSGKSTIGKMILQLISTTEGQILFDGVDITTLQGDALKEYYRKVQGVFQDPFSSYNPIFKAERVFQVIKEEFFPHLSQAEWSQRVEKAIRSVGLNPEIVLNKYPHQLSGGQLQRMLIARALLLDIKFLVADEIISMLDATTRIDVLNLLADLKNRGLSILFITHDLSLGYYISDKVVILYHGHVVEMGSTVKVFDNSQHPYTRLLMAAVPRLDQKWDAVTEECDNQEENNPAYCPYIDRCQDAGKGDACKAVQALVEIEPDHFVACCARSVRKTGA